MYIFFFKFSHVNRIQICATIFVRKISLLLRNILWIYIVVVIDLTFFLIEKIDLAFSLNNQKP